MKILITGHQGYVGSAFAAHVAREGYGWRMTGADTAFFKNQLTGEDPAKYFVREFLVDVRDLSADHLKDCDAVVHLAAISNDPIGMEFEAATREINAVATIRLAGLCRDAGVPRFVFASSCSMYGEGNDAPRSETDELKPLTAYARAKAAAEAGLETIAADGLQITCLRFATACGPSPRLRLDLVMNDFVASAMQTGRIQVLSDGTPWRPLIHTNDMARAIAWALQREDRPFRAINIGSSSWTWQIRDLARAVADVLGGVEVGIDGASGTDKRSYRVDFSLFEQLAPSHQPASAFNDTVFEIRDCVERLRFGGIPFRQSPFVRLNALRELRTTNAIFSDLRWAPQMRAAKAMG